MQKAGGQTRRVCRGSWRSTFLKDRASPCRWWRRQKARFIVREPDRFRIALKRDDASRETAQKVSSLVPQRGCCARVCAPRFTQRKGQRNRARTRSVRWLGMTRVQLSAGTEPSESVAEISANQICPLLSIEITNLSQCVSCVRSWGCVVSDALAVDECNGCVSRVGGRGSHAMRGVTRCALITVSSLPALAPKLPLLASVCALISHVACPEHNRFVLKATGRSRDRALNSALSASGERALAMLASVRILSTSISACAASAVALLPSLVSALCAPTLLIEPSVNGA